MSNDGLIIENVDLSHIHLAVLCNIQSVQINEYEIAPYFQ